MIIEILLLIVALYIIFGAGIYFGSVIIYFCVAESWNFQITKTHVSNMEYPRWTLFWLEWIVRTVSKMRKE